MSTARRNPLDLVDPYGEGRSRLAERDRELILRHIGGREGIPMPIWREWEQELHAQARRQQQREGRESKEKRCGARCKSRNHAPCQAPGAKRPDGTRSKRCRVHGGLSTGAKTPEGRAKALSKLKRGPNQPKKGEP